MEQKQKINSKIFMKVKSNLHSKMKSKVVIIPHHTVPGYNLRCKHDSHSYDIQSVVETHEPFPYKCDLPKPLLPGAPLSRTVLSGEDPALQLLVTKTLIEDEIKRVTDLYKAHMKDTRIPYKKDIKYEQSNGKIQCNVTGCVAQIAELVEADPDPYFSGTYNWYYTGGTLKRLKLNNDIILLCPFSSELVATPLVSKGNSIIKPELKNASKCSLDGTLYDIKYCTVNDICFVMGRFKHDCVFYRLTNVKDKLELFEIESQLSFKPLVSADMHHTNPNYFCTASVERSVVIWDVTKMKPLVRNVIKHSKLLHDNWSSLSYQSYDNNILVYTDRCCVHYLDTRIPMEDPVLSLCPKKRLENCENICLNIASRNENCNYIGTYHSFMLLDKRSKECVLQKWTHQLKSAPLLADVCNRNDRELLVYSSQLPTETGIIVNTWTSENDAISKSLPYRVPNILKSLSNAKRMGKCLDPLTRQRLQLCNTGCCFMTDNNNDTFYFVQNSMGDVFYQCVSHEKDINSLSIENIRAIDALEQWERSTCTKNNLKPLTFNDKTDMRYVYNQLTNTTLKLEQEQYEELTTPGWKEPLSKLSTYADLLAPDLLKMWEVSEEPVVPLSVAPHQKVLNWLGSSKAAAIADLPSQSTYFSQESNPFSAVNTQELVSITQTLNPDHNPVKLQEPEDDLEQFLPKVTIKSKQNHNKRKNPQFVAGF